MIKEGDKAINFNMPIDEKTNITLETYTGKNIVLYFYPKDDTPGCTKEAIDFTAHLEEFTKHDTVIIGVSADSLKQHKKFSEKHSLNVILASDEDKKTCEDYGVWVEKSMYGKKYMGIERSTFIINSKGVLIKEWRKVKVNGHADEVLKYIKELDKN